jgi:hypothetical protein
MFQLVKLWLFSGIYSIFGLAPGHSDIETLRSYLAQGNAAAISDLMHSSVQLSTPQGEGFYSKGQATMILDKFFRSHPPRQCLIVNQGSSENGAHYSIMRLETGNGNYRVSVFLKKGNTGLLIQEMKIAAQP